MPLSSRAVKDLGAGASASKKPPAIAASSEHAGDKSNLLEFRPRVDAVGPQDPEPSPLIGCGPVRYRIEDFRLNIITAARAGRHYRSIAAQYGLNALEVWKIVTDALAAEQWKNRRAA